VSNFIEE